MLVVLVRDRRARRFAADGDGPRHERGDFRQPRIARHGGLRLLHEIKRVNRALRFRETRGFRERDVARPLGAMLPRDRQSRDDRAREQHEHDDGHDRRPPPGGNAALDHRSAAASFHARSTCPRSSTVCGRSAGARFRADMTTTRTASGASGRSVSISQGLRTEWREARRARAAPRTAARPRASRTRSRRTPRCRIERPRDRRWPSPGAMYATVPIVVPV